jgi:acyl-CoA synthetase (NDP forming)
MPDSAKTSLYQLMHPQHIAVIGASNNMLNMGTRILSNLISLGFQGQVFPVHPKLDQVLGLKAYPDVNQIPLVADLAVIVVPTASVSKVLRECGQKGIRQAIIISGGFREAGPEGRRRENELIDIAQQYGIRFLGPNCIGVVNPRHRFNTTVCHYAAAMEGFIGMVSQSGSFVTQMFYHLEKFGLGFSQAFSIGNQADIDLADCIEYLEGCERTRVIGLYIEGIQQTQKFMRIARAVSKRKPIVALYVGGTEAGGRAGGSHTGALAGSDRIHDGVFRQCGIVRALLLGFRQPAADERQPRRRFHAFRRTRCGSRRCGRSRRLKTAALIAPDAGKHTATSASHRFVKQSHRHDLFSPHR